MIFRCEKCGSLAPFWKKNAIYRDGHETPLFICGKCHDEWRKVAGKTDFDNETWCGIPKTCPECKLKIDRKGLHIVETRENRWRVSVCSLAKR